MDIASTGMPGNSQNIQYENSSRMFQSLNQEQKTRKSQIVNKGILHSPELAASRASLTPASP